MEDFSLTRTNFSQQVADHLEAVILKSSASFESGKLPSEQQLVKQYNVSRPVIREALKLLQERGLVTLKNGIGASISIPESTTVFSAVSRLMQMNNISNQDLTEMRGILEVSAAKLAAKNATNEDILALRENLKAFSDKTLPLPERVKLDSQFHILIAKASHNALMEMFSEVLLSLLVDYMGKGVLIGIGVDDAITRHNKIVDALETHDENKVIIAMDEHIRASEQNVLEYDKEKLV